MTSDRLSVLRARENLLAIVAVTAAVFLGALDQTVVVTALPAVIVDLKIPFDKLDQGAWIVSIYLLGYTVALPLMGKMADVRGRRPVLLAALGLFAVGSLGCAAAPDLPSLLIARFVQAFGGGALLPVALAVAADRTTEHRRSIVVGSLGAAAEAGGVLGPLWGSLVIHFLSWRWIFWLNVPLALAFLAVAVLGLRDIRRHVGRVDYGGGLIATAMLAALVLGLAQEPILIGGLDLRAPLLVVSAVALVGFVLWERRDPDPLVDFGLFRLAGLSIATIGGILLGCALIAAMVDVPLFADTALGWDATRGGLLLVRMTVFIPIGAFGSGWLVHHLGMRFAAAFGFALSCVGLIAMSFWGLQNPEAALWLALAPAGLGFGILITPLMTAAVNAVGAERAGVASGLISLSRLTGMTIGVAALTALGLSRFQALASSVSLPLPQPGQTQQQAQDAMNAYEQHLLQLTVQVFHEIFLVAALICVVGLLTALFLPRTSRVDPDAIGIFPPA